ncbi:E3 ubiquitin ligase family protein [Natronomonas marina]|uniref:E3 ubiquitin ligase family protein n=1 Tax=Natronomonas marina TaxID=2961939 RepID=UPI0020C9A54F|nr:E3 ubiquitin ligase family protein [Natronomonas marina]
MSSIGTILGVLVAVGGLVSAGYGYRRRRRRDAIAAVETTDALRVTPGPTELYGTAEPADGGAMRAPFSEEDCVLAEWKIEEWEESGKHSSWRTEGSGTLAAPFYLDDGTDQVLVRPDEASVELSGGWGTTEVGVDETPPEPIQAFIDLDATPGEPNEALVKSLDWGTQVGDRRYRQRTLASGEEVYVHGTATRVGAETFGGNDFEVVAAADDGHPDADLFLVADSPESKLLERRRDWVLYLGAGVVGVVAGGGLLVSSLL